MVDQLLLPKFQFLLRFLHIVRQELGWNRLRILHTMLLRGVVRSESLVAEALVVDFIASGLPLEVILVLVGLDFDPPLPALHRLPDQV